eukprot:73719-Chlamydomonas_euryale.AAC.1
MTRACVRRSGSGQRRATLPSVRPGSRCVLLIQVQAWFMVLFAMVVIWQQKMWKLLRPEKPAYRVKSEEVAV